MKKYTLSVLVVLVALLALGGWIWYGKMKENTQEQNQVKVIDSQNSTPISKPVDNQQVQLDEIASVKDLIDGEYKIQPVATSNWQTYRNEELGFEVKIPKNWELRNSYKEDGKYIDFSFSQKGKKYLMEGGNEDAIGIGVSFKTNQNFSYSEHTLVTWKNFYNITIKSLIVNSVPFYYYRGFGEGVKTNASFPRDYSFSLGSSIDLDLHPEVKETLHGMIQSIKFYDVH